MTQFTTLDLRSVPLALKRLWLCYYCFLLAGLWEESILLRLNWLQMAKLAFQTKLLFGLSSSPISGTAACSSLALANLFSPAQMLLLAGVAPRGSLPFPIATAPITWQTLLSRQVSAGNLLHPLDPRC